MANHDSIMRSMADWFNFFELAPRDYLHMSYSSRFLDTRQLGMWKLFAAVVLLLFAVLVPCLWMPWSGTTSDGREQVPALLNFTVASSVLAMLSMLVAAANLLRSLLKSGLTVQRKIHPWSWEMVDWTLYQFATTAAITAFFFFWLIQFPETPRSISVLQIEGVIVLGAVTGLDFFLSAPLFRSSHVWLALMWPALWLIIQLVWVINGHRPADYWLNFHTWHSPVCGVGLCAITVTVFFVLQHLAPPARRVRPRSKPAVTSSHDCHLEESHADVIDSSRRGSPRVAQYQLMAGRGSE